jgi:hypothetical protein
MATDRQHWQHAWRSRLRAGRSFGETEVGHWHRHDEGFGSRRPLADLPTGRSSGTPIA